MMVILQRLRTAVIHQDSQFAFGCDLMTGAIQSHGFIVYLVQKSNFGFSEWKLNLCYYNCGTGSREQLLWSLSLGDGAVLSKTWCSCATITITTNFVSENLVFPYRLKFRVQMLSVYVQGLSTNQNYFSACFI